MQERVILISAVSGDIGCSAVRVLSEAGYSIIGCDMNPYSPVSSLLRKFYQAPSSAKKNDYLSFLKDVLAKESVEYFLPVSEPEIRVLHEHREELLQWDVKIVLNNKVVIDNFLDKLKTAQYLSAIDIKTPRTSLLCDYKDNYGFPLIVKPRIGYGNKKNWKVEHARDIDYLRKQEDNDLIVQEYVGTDAEEYTTGVFSDGHTISSITFRRKLGLGGLSVEAVLSEEPFIDDLAAKIARATGLIGSINIQTRRVSSGPCFVPFEINPRLSSTLLFRKKFGFNDLQWWLNALDGKGYQYQKQFKSGRAIRYASECYFDMNKIEQ